MIIGSAAETSRQKALFANGEDGLLGFQLKAAQLTRVSE